MVLLLLLLLSSLNDNISPHCRYFFAFPLPVSYSDLMLLLVFMFFIVLLLHHLFPLSFPLVLFLHIMFPIFLFLFSCYFPSIIRYYYLLRSSEVFCCLVLALATFFFLIAFLLFISFMQFLFIILLINGKTIRGPRAFNTWTLQRMLPLAVSLMKRSTGGRS